jgi:hypothetical protein
MHRRENARNLGPKNPYKQGIKNPNYGKRASCIGDGYLTVRGSEVLISLEFKIGQIIFLKGPKKEQKCFQKNS